MIQATQRGLPAIKKEGVKMTKIVKLSTVKIDTNTGKPVFPDDGLNPDVDIHLDLVIDTDNISTLISVIRFVFVNGITLSVCLDGCSTDLFKASDFNYDCDYLSWLVSRNF